MADEFEIRDEEIYLDACGHVQSFLAAISNVRVREYREAVWFIEKRVKTRGSIEQKLLRKRKQKPGYDVQDLTDLAGVRVIVDGVSSARALSEFIRTKKAFDVWEEKSEDFSDVARADGYRAVHLVLRVPSPFLHQETVPVELQVRTMLQHQWSLLSNSEFYKAIGEIPPSLLARMRALGDILHAADIEADQLRQNRVLDDVGRRVRLALRQNSVEKLEDASTVAGGAREIGLGILMLLEIDTQARRALVSGGDSKMRASKCVEGLCASLLAHSPDLQAAIDDINARMRPVILPIPEAL